MREVKSQGFKREARKGAASLADAKRSGCLDIVLM